MSNVKNSLQMNPSLVLSLIVATVVIGSLMALYYLVVWPMAAAAQNALGSGAATNPWVIFKDVEQLSCLMLGFFCLFIIAYKAKEIGRQSQINTKREFNKFKAITNNTGLEALYTEINDDENENRGTAPMTVWSNCIKRFNNTGSVHDASEAMKDSIAMLEKQLEAGNNVIRYIIWAIPSIGFVGTVRGIGSALARAQEAVAGNIGGMVDMLGVAFNSTLVSLIISLVLMLALHILNNLQDKLVIDIQKMSEDTILNYMHLMKKAS